MYMCVYVYVYLCINLCLSRRYEAEKRVNPQISGCTLIFYAK